jgi:hypothetical protein
LSIGEVAIHRLLQLRISRIILAGGKLIVLAPVIPHAFGERAVLKLMYAALIRGAEPPSLLHMGALPPRYAKIGGNRHLISVESGR